LGCSAICGEIEKSRINVYKFELETNDQWVKYITREALTKSSRRGMQNTNDDGVSLGEQFQTFRKNANSPNKLPY